MSVHTQRRSGRSLAAAIGAVLVCAVTVLSSTGAVAQIAPSTAASAPAAAQHAETSRLDAVLSAGTLRVGTTGDYKPFTYLNPQTQKFEGMDIDLAEAMGKALGVKVEFVKTSWSTLLPDLLADKYDIAVGGVSVTLERQKKALFSAPLMRDGKTPITRCENKDRFQTVADIDKPGVRLIVNPGGTNEKFARANIRTAQIEVHPDNVTIFDQIVAGKADLMITDAVETRLQQKLHPELCAVHPDRPFDFSEKAFLLPRDIVLKLWVDQWLHQTVATGQYQAVFDRWLK
ncbi:cyclohexadienyl dehydratase [Azospirillum lipoferum]|uniref:Transporter substrate-binding domain-containing protein n=1 Tax=Azospirillum lipoferum TaxID=193 RepID=A0A5A9GTP7_AZOLI|nr:MULTISPECIES: transporter substrate-binding domain-containing protein [Azospirillum]KAA0597831.1 transporter substrate-binding domain-containing protein [Azospirillum lipoferum]MCP1610028.1 cyclohexadienyl dehydratase [Azospirillum lipoferum]MDW5534479.1 transporter substrate-binding domain-containing protein [Azospirillum sp. NL1]